jgi:hypothetical protein
VDAGMTRRRILCGLLLASAVLACFAGWLVSHPRSMRARFEQVQKGMSRDEVIRTVGGPPANYADLQMIRRTYFEGVGCDACWVGDDAKLIVYFDDAGTVMATVIVDASPPPLTLTERIRRWLGL